VQREYVSSHEMQTYYEEEQGQCLVIPLVNDNGPNTHLNCEIDRSPWVDRHNSALTLGSETDIANHGSRKVLRLPISLSPHDWLGRSAATRRLAALLTPRRSSIGTRDACIWATTSDTNETPPDALPLCEWNAGLTPEKEVR
jgi:hypothetical protein